MTARLKHLLCSRSGASAVEFAIIAPVFFLTLFSLIGYGIYLSAAHSVQQLAADAARTAVAGLNATERKELVRNFLDTSTMNHAFLKKDHLTLDVEDDPKNPNQFTVAIEYDAGDLPIWNLFSYALPDQRIRRFSTMRMGGI
ncbi:TadE/TadG family type IV pilus assembly protein [Rhizobium sp. LCM 4573]|uniref:TadE/TadG family type IV pilus assembly protein n=1 Tax=Rhizobium sp. LCM 4573 TaxID=1848291 RepID=UPI0008DAE009|nr:TadE/TadG family type IV pilus assembly protein [Rhizobium sp. LCM 4573]OHV81107.1 hypothetical protein LCM4573_22290 [Rhizobium sp. LCM 4573]